ncbi:MAG: hypothetical protein IJX27_01920 [Clostridia bacterium]|nr:hypothetical protein [Clostridia bacterium]
MIYKFKTKKALKFLVWLSTGVNAMLVCLFTALQTGDMKIAALGALAAVVQIIHGVKVAFFNKTLVNMLLGFCKFQCGLLFFATSIAALELGGVYGITVFALAAFEFAVSLIIPRRKQIVDGIRELLLI